MRLTILFLFISLSAFGQNPYNYGSYNYGSYNYGDKSLAISEIIVPGGSKEACYSGFFISGSDTLWKDISGHGRHATLRYAKNFVNTSEWIAGVLPYASEVLVIFPVSLLSFDLDSFMFAGGGVARSIPTISFFQDIDYGHKLFCKEIAQQLNSDSTEVHGSGVRYFTVYSAVQTGGNLTACNTFFGVPALAASYKVVATNGNNTTGDGSFAIPWATLAKAQTSAGANDIIYIKTGSYNLGGSAQTLTKTVKGISYCRIYNSGTSYGLYLHGASKIYERLVVDGLTTGSAMLIDVLGVEVKKCYFINQKATGYINYGNGAVYENCVMKCGTLNYVSSSATQMTVKNCYISGTPAQGFITPTAGANFIMQYNKMTTIPYFIYTSAVVVGNITTLGNKGNCGSYINVKNYGDITCTNDNITLNTSNFIYSNPTTETTGTVTITNSTVVGNNTAKLLTIFGKSVQISGLNITQNGGGSCIDIYSATQTCVWNIENSLLKTTHTSGGVLDYGDDTFVIENKGTGYFRNNVVLGNGYYLPSPTSSHGVSIWSNAGIEIYNNKIYGWLFPIVLKGNGTDYASCKVHHNLLLNGRVIVKGIQNCKIYNNTFYNASKATPNLESVIFDDSETHTLGTIIKNNIFVNLNALYSNIEFDDGDTFISDNNIFYCIVDKPASYGEVQYTFAQWQALTYDINSLNQNPNLTTGLWPTTPITGAENLGTDYDDGLDVTTNWGSSTQVPVIVTKQQTGSWQIGAYVQ